MPNLKSSKKSVNVIAKKTSNNTALGSKVKNLLKKCDKAIDAGSKEEAIKIYNDLQKTIDKSVSKGITKKNTADRQKSRLNKKINSIQ